MEHSKKSTLKTPLLIYDGNCKFCIKCVKRIQKITGEKVNYQPYQKAAEKFPQFPKEAFEKEVKLIMPDGEYFSAAHAIFKTIEIGKGKSRLLWAYKKIPGFAWIAECVYRLVAKLRANL